MALGTRVSEDLNLIKPNISARMEIPTSTQNLNQKETIKLTTEIIRDYERNGVYKNGGPAWQRVGGPIDILWIPRNKKYNARWLRKKKGHGFKEICSFLKWVRKTEHVKLISDFGREEIERIISEIERQTSCLE